MISIIYQGWVGLWNVAPINNKQYDRIQDIGWYIKWEKTQFIVKIKQTESEWQTITFRKRGGFVTITVTAVHADDILIFIQFIIWWYSVSLLLYLAVLFYTNLYLKRKKGGANNTCSWIQNVIPKVVAIGLWNSTSFALC
jgi:hypothetical protein